MKFHLAPLLLLPFLTLELNAAFRASMAFLTSNVGNLNVFEAGYTRDASGRYIMMGYSEMNIEYKNDSDVVSSMPNDVFKGNRDFIPTDGFRGQNAGASAGGVDLTLIKMASHQAHYDDYMTNRDNSRKLHRPAIKNPAWNTYKLYDTKVKFQKTVLKSGQKGDSFVVTPLVLGFVFPTHFGAHWVPAPAKLNPRLLTAQLLNPTHAEASSSPMKGRIDAGAIYLHKDGDVLHPPHIKLVPTISCYMTDDFMDWTDANGDGVTNARIRGCDQGSSPVFDEFDTSGKKDANVFVYKYYNIGGTAARGDPAHPDGQALNKLEQRSSWSGRKAVFVISIKSITGEDTTNPNEIPPGKYEGNFDIIFHVR